MNLLKSLFVDRLTGRQLIFVTLIGVMGAALYLEPSTSHGIERVGRWIAYSLPAIVSLPILIIYALLIYFVAVAWPVALIAIVLKEMWHALTDVIRDTRAAVRAIKRASERES